MYAILSTMTHKCKYLHFFPPIANQQQINGPRKFNLLVQKLAPNGVSSASVNSIAVPTQ